MSLATLVAWWRQWTGRSASRRILGAAAIVVAGTALVKLAAVAKEIAVAQQFGTGDAFDAFLIAFVIPSFAINVIAGGFAAAAMPVYVDLQERQAAEAQELLGTAIVSGLALLTIVAVFLGAFAPLLLPLIASGFGPQKLEITQHLLWLLLPAIVLGGATLMIEVALHAEERFAGVSIAPVCVPLVTLAAVLVLTPTIGVKALVVGVVAGYALHVLVLFALVRRSGFRLEIRRWRLTPHLRAVGKQYAPMVAGRFLTSGTGLVDQSMAAMLVTGSVASLAYGSRLVAVVVGVSCMALGTAALPHFSRMVARNEWDQVTATLRTWTRFIGWTSALGLLVLLPLSEDLVRLVLQHGAFTATDTQVVGRIQSLYLLQLPFHVAGILYVRLISALRANRYLVWGAALNLLLNITLNLLFMKWLGAAGIALSTSVVYLASCAFLLLVLKRELPRARMRAAVEDVTGRG